MGGMIKCKFFAMSLFFVIYFVPAALGYDLEFYFHFSQRENRIELHCKNFSGKAIRLPWLKRGGAAFLLLSKNGELFRDSRWQLPTERNLSHGAGFIIQFWQDNHPDCISYFPAELNQFANSDGIEKKDQPVLYLTAFINSSLGGRLPLIQTPFYLLELANGKVENLKGVALGEVPTSVREAVAAEQKKIQQEELSAEFGYW